MNILYLSHAWNIIGGGEVSLLALLAEIDRSEFQPSLMVSDEGEVANRARALNVPVMVIPFKRLRNPLNLCWCVGFVKRMLKILRQEQIGLIHCNSTSGIALLGSIAARIAGIPFVWHVRVITFGWLLDLFVGLLSTRIIAISEAVRNRFWWMRGSPRLVIVHNGVDLQRFNPSVEGGSFRKEIGCGDKDLLVGTVGRFHPIKGYEYFIRSASVVVKKVPEAKFLIVGLNYHENNRYLDSLRNLARDLGLEDKIIFTGSRDDVPEIMASLDLFVLSSTAEAFGRVVVEAMACGKPVIAFGGGGVLDIVEDGVTGLLAAPRDSDGLADRIVRVLEDRDAAAELGTKGRQRAEELFGIAAHAKKIEDLYLGLIHREEDDT